MKKITLLFASLLSVAYIAVAQLKLYVYQNDGTRTEFVASIVDSIAFSTITDSPDQPDDPIKPVDPTNGHEYVDLGLPSGTKWATCNVGADSPEEYGDYFAWGETTPKSTYNWGTYKWCNGSYDTQTKYCISSSFGTVDNKTTLDLSDDAAYVNWGTSWRMPTEEEQDELRNTSYTTWTLTTQNGVKGYKVTSKTNGNSIFLPAEGYRSNLDLYDAGSDGSYWSSSLNTYYSSSACYLYFDSDYVYSNYENRYYGKSIRPVLRDVEFTFTFTIMFDGNGGEGTMPAIDGQHDGRVKIPASTFTRDGYYFVGWNTKADGSGASYTVGESLTLTTDLTLYAQWKEIIKYYTISFNANGGNGSMNSIELEEGKNFTIPSNPFTRTDYQFVGWNTKANDTGTSYSVGESILLTADLTLYAQWEKLVNSKLYFVNTDNWSGVNAYVWIDGTSKEYIEWPGEQATKENITKYDYNIYSYDMSDKELYNMIIFNEKSSSLTPEQTKDLKIDYSKPYFYKGIWYKSLDDIVETETGTTFTIMFDGNGGEGTMPAIDGQHDDRVKIPASTFTRDGYYFVGWNTKANGTGTAYTEGETISITANTTLYAQWEEYRISGKANGHYYVDLGLPSGTLWATCNVGADSPEEYGDYFAWGETEPKAKYNWRTYKWMTDEMSSWNSWKGVNKYTFVDGQTSGVWYNNYGNFIGDRKTTLDPYDDAAYVNWGNRWRMPTKAEQYELRNTNYTTWTWTTQNGVKGYKVTSKTNGNSIFLPAAGYRRDSSLGFVGSYGYYWSSSLDTNNSGYAYVLYFYSDNINMSGNNLYNDRSSGQSVRPVLRE